jgi:hypothetical protein
LDCVSNTDTIPTFIITLNYIIFEIIVADVSTFISYQIFMYVSVLHRKKIDPRSTARSTARVRGMH